MEDGRREEKMEGREEGMERKETDRDGGKGRIKRLRGGGKRDREGRRLGRNKGGRNNRERDTEGSKEFIAHNLTKVA